MKFDRPTRRYSSTTGRPPWRSRRRTDSQVEGRRRSPGCSSTAPSAATRTGSSATTSKPSRAANTINAPVMPGTTAASPFVSAFISAVMKNPRPKKPPSNRS